MAGECVHLLIVSIYPFPYPESWGISHCVLPSSHETAETIEKRDRREAVTGRNIERETAHLHHQTVAIGHFSLCIAIEPQDYRDHRGRCDRREAVTGCNIEERETIHLHH